MKRAGFLVALIACGSPSQQMIGGDDVVDVDAPTTGGDGPVVGDDAPPTRAPRTVFVIPLENKSATAIYGNTSDAPYINSLLATHAHASNFGDALPSLPSEPHYVWMEAGTNVFADRTFTSDSDASSSNSTSSTQHLSAQLTAANIPWMSYQESISAGACPISSGNHYVAKHNPFVFFRDTVGSPPNSANGNCIAHHRPYSSFAADLANGIDGYVFITPNECNDMHGALSCPSGIFDAGNIQAGDAWLSNELPRIITYTETHDAVIFITWDEGDSSNLIPFIAIGKNVKAGYTSTVSYNHSSLLKSTEQFLGVPVLPTVESANNFADMFEPGTFP